MTGLELADAEQEAAPTIDDLRAELASVQAESDERRRTEAEERRAAALRTWEAAREQSAKDLSARLGRAAQDILAGQFDPTGLGDLMAAVSVPTDKAIRARIDALSDDAAAPRGPHHPSDRLTVRRAAALSQEIARLEDEERRIARIRRNSTTEEDR